MANTIFSQVFLNEHVPATHLDAVVGLRKKREIIQNWIDSFASNKIDYFKEEEVKSRFIMEMFGQVLGYNYQNPGVWLCREEVKTEEDATKPDAALGVFRTTPKGIVNDVYVVIEIKGAKSNLDKAQNRAAFKVTPVDQAFLYAGKMGGKCKWVVVSNFEEIRFYHHSDQGRYQPYLLKDLLQDEALREFLFLFHKDQWTNEQISVTDKLYSLKDKLLVSEGISGHILDKLYHLLFKFEGLEFIDPNYIANLKPFNVLEEYVWHFRDNTLYTLNPAIYDLLSQVTNTGTEIQLSPELERTLKKAHINDYLKKIKYVLNRLYQFLIREIVAVKGVNLDKLNEDVSLANRYRSVGFISGLENIRLKTLTREINTCDCINCNYRSLDFKKLMRKTRAAKGNSQLTAKELAYSHYQLATDNFKESYYIYKKAELDSKGVENRNIEYFLTKINLSYLHNLVSGYDNDNAEILKDIKKIDLDRSLHNELDVYVDEDVRKYLIQIKEFQLFNNIEKKIAELLEEIRDKKELFNNNGHYSGPNHLALLIHQYHLLYSHFHKNYLIYDAFSDFKKAVTHFFEGLVTSYQTKNYGLIKFNEFYLTEAVLYIPRKDLINLLRDEKQLEIEFEELEIFVAKTISFLNSLFDSYSLGSIPNPEFKAQLTNFQFKEKYENSFSNLFTLLSRLDLTEEQARRLVQPIINFINTEDFLAHYELHELGVYLERHGKVFKRHEVVELLSFAINHTRPGYVKYDSLINSLCVIYPQVSVGKSLSEQSIIRRAVANLRDDHGRFDFRDLLVIYPILNDAGQMFFKNEILAQLERSFEVYYYEILLERKILSWQDGAFFEKYVQQTQRQNFKADPVFEGETYDLKNTVMVSFLGHYHFCGVPADAPGLSILSNLSPFATWALHPEVFDYSLFDARWLLVLMSPQFLKRVAKIKAIKTLLQKYLKGKPESALAPLYISYFL
ncbi:MAG: hypothetical protein V4577_13685 [Bacteroidota bacterium]